MGKKTKDGCINKNEEMPFSLTKPMKTEKAGKRNRKHVGDKSKEEKFKPSQTSQIAKVKRKELDNTDNSDSEDYIGLFNKKCKSIEGKIDSQLDHEITWSQKGNSFSSDMSDLSSQVSSSNSSEDSSDSGTKVVDVDHVKKRSKMVKSGAKSLVKHHKAAVSSPYSESEQESQSSDSDDGACETKTSTGLPRKVKKSSETKSFKLVQEDGLQCQSEDTDDSHSSGEDMEEQGSFEDQFAAIRKELEDMPFEEVQKLQERVGMKVYNQVFGSMPGQRANQGKRIFKRENKNRPREMSSKRRVSVFREVVPVRKKVVRDPRFDDLSGNFNEDIFKKSYTFLSDIKQSEKQKLLKKLKKEKDEEKKKQLEYLIQRMTNQERAEKEKEARKQRMTHLRKQEQEMVTEGKKPFYLKKSEQRKLELAEKYRQLQKSGKIDNYLGKKRKKNATKDRKRLPFRVDK